MTVLRPAVEMKDSGIEWVGRIPSDWNVVPIRTCFNEVVEKNKDGLVKNALKFTYGEIVPKTNFDADEDDYVADTILNYYVVMPGTIMINGLNLNFDLISQRTALVREKGIITSAYVGIIPKDYDVTLPEFMNYLFKAYDYRMAFHNMGGGVRKILNFTRLKSQMVCFPPLLEQQAIADYLDDRCSKIDEIIAEAAASIEEYKKLKQAVIFEAVTKGLDKTVPMKDSGVEWIGEIPFDWHVVKATRIIDFTQNGITRRDLEKSTGQIVLKLRNIDADGHIDYSFVNRIELSKDELNRYILSNNDLLFVRVNGSKELVGKCAIFQSIDEPVAYNDHIIRVRLNQHCSVSYLKWVLLSPIGKREITSRIKTSAGQHTLSGQDLRDIRLCLPPIKIQNSIAMYLEDKCNSIENIIVEKQSLINDLQAYKKSLIYEVVTGKRRVV